MTTLVLLRQGGQNRNYDLTDLISSFFFFFNWNIDFILLALVFLGGGGGIFF